jgi:hypothetical protein
MTRVAPSVCAGERLDAIYLRLAVRELWPSLKTWRTEQIVAAGDQAKSIGPLGSPASEWPHLSIDRQVRALAIYGDLCCSVPCLQRRSAARGCKERHRSAHADLHPNCPQLSKDARQITLAVLAVFAALVPAPAAAYWRSEVIHPVWRGAGARGTHSLSPAELQGRRPFSSRFSRQDKFDPTGTPSPGLPRPGRMGRLIPGLVDWCRITHHGE